jgi:diguanylate cyclase (GGDEF)-like protein
MTRDRGQARVLLVDDDPVAVASLGRALRSRNLRIYTATSAKCAWEVLDRMAIELVVSDENMPGTHGTEFLADLRAHDPTIGRIMLTGDSRADVAIRAVNDASVSRFHVKPCTVDELVMSINDVLTTRHETLAQRSKADSVRVSNARLDHLLAHSWMAFQPIVTGAGGATVAVEALIRSRDTESSAAEIVDLAIRLDRQLDLDEVVTSNVTRVLSSLAPDQLLFVNVFPTSLMNAELLIDGPLARHARRVVIEVTEHVAGVDPTELPSRLRALRECGYRIAVDDLGTGYSSLSVLEVLEPEYVKLDASLIHDLDERTSRSDLVDHLLRHNRTIRAVSIAEGVETQRESSWLTAHGCELQQGYLHGRPSSAEALKAPATANSPTHGPGPRTRTHAKVDPIGSREATHDAPNQMSVRAAAFNRLSACAAVLDAHGSILDSNESWRLFTSLNDGDLRATGPGTNYLDVCDRAALNGADGAAEVAAGIRQVLSGERDRFDFEYPCPSPIEDRWFLLQASAAPVSAGSGAVVQHIDITARKLSADALSVLADHDPLTGLPNRRAALRYLEQQLQAATSSSVPVWVLFLDLDGFKAVNDRHGHHVGDELLTKVAIRLRRVLREQDRVCRLGGDEFVLICPGLGEETAAQVAERVRTAVTAPFQIDDLEIAAGVSVGVAMSAIDSSAEDLLSTADSEMYLDKRGTRR